MEEKDYAGACGLYCGLCPRLQSTAQSRCLGCQLGPQHDYCTVYRCASKRGYLTCADCTDYACDKLLRTVGDGVDSFVSHRPMLGNLDRIRQAGLETYLAEQRELAIKLLSSLGYKVQAVASGQEAVEYLAQNDVDILVLDMIMEDGFDGLDTYRQIVKIRPGQRAIIASGFSETTRVKEAQRLGAGPFVKKPYTLETIGRAVHQELQRR